MEGKKKVTHLPKPDSAYGPRPELWRADENLFLIYPSICVTTPLVRHEYDGENRVYIMETRNTVYVIDWIPTIRNSTLYDVILEHGAIKRKSGQRV